MLSVIMKACISLHSILHMCNINFLPQATDILKMIYIQFQKEKEEGHVRNIDDPMKRLSSATGNRKNFA